MDRNVRHSLYRAQSEKAHRTNVKLAFCAVFGISVYLGVKVALTYADNVWGLSAILIIPCAIMFVFWVINALITKKRLANLHDYEASQSVVRAVETEARVKKAREDGTLDKWKSS